MKKTNYGMVLGLIAGVILAQSLVAQPSRTGTNLNAKAMPTETLVLQEPDEVGRIRQLLNEGKKNDALVAVEAYIEEVDRTSLKHESLPKYYAWNAYCTVLTSLRRFDEAIAACTTAMAFEPGKWSAVNNRGTAKFVAGRLDEAMLDYETALTLAGENNLPVRETIQHNINLLEAQR